VEPLNSKDPKTIGGFTLVGRLGKGGMGVVYLASRKSESVALKVIRDSLIDDEAEATRFSREVSALEQIASTNVARIVHAGVDDGRAWFAAEFVNGPNLSELVNDKGPLDEDQWWELARGLLNGLADVHKTGVIHRDIKPANVIVAETGPKLIDFGIAHVSDATSVTATGLVAGSPAWFSPEQIEGLELTSATDVFSAGSVLTFAATGSSPWGGETTMTKASVFKILTSEPELSGLSPEQRFLLEQMLSKEPTGRPTAESLGENLDHIRGGKQPNLASSDPPVTRKSGDATTTTKRAVLNQTVRALQQTNTTAPGGGVNSPAVGAMTSKNRSRLLVATVSLVAIVGFLLLGTSSGSGKVNVSVTEVPENPAIGSFSLRISSGSVEPVTLDLQEKESFPAVFSWKTGEPLRFSYEPPFSEDESYEGTVLPSELGLNGFSNATALFVHVSLEGTSTLLSFRTSANRDANEVYAIRLARGNEQRQLTECVTETSRTLDVEVEPYEDLYSSYQASLEQARLNESGFRLYTTWSSRILNLINLMQSNVQGAEASSSSRSEAAWAYVEPILSAHSQLMQAWSAQRQSAQQGAYLGGDNSAPNWDDNWTRIYSAENLLRESTQVGSSAYAESLCSESVS
jgi:serine/threonine protein kinase